MLKFIQEPELWKRKNIMNHYLLTQEEILKNDMLKM